MLMASCNTLLVRAAGRHGAAALLLRFASTCPNLAVYKACCIYCPFLLPLSPSLTLFRLLLPNCVLSGEAP
jgi:hypothetical protein